MASGCLTGNLRLTDGRSFGWAEYGAPGGRPVMALHGTPACRLMFASAADPAFERGLRLIAPDRPGYGLSGPQPGRSFADGAADIAALMDHLAIASAPILAISGGCPYAVTTAAHLGHRISGLALVSPLGEVGAPASAALLTRRERALFTHLPLRPGLLRLVARSIRWGFQVSPSLTYAAFSAMLSPADRRVLAQPAARQLVLEMTREALRQGIEGAISDLALFATPWNVDVSTIRQPAVVWQGTADRMVPSAAVFDLARRLGACSLRHLQEHGHFWIIDHVEEVLDGIPA